MMMEVGRAKGGADEQWKGGGRGRGGGGITCGGGSLWSCGIPVRVGRSSVTMISGGASCSCSDGGDPTELGCLIRWIVGKCLQWAYTTSACIATVVGYYCAGQDREDCPAFWEEDSSPSLRCFCGFSSRGSHTPHLRSQASARFSSFSTWVIPVWADRVRVLGGYLYLRLRLTVLAVTRVLYLLFSF